MYHEGVVAIVNLRTVYLMAAILMTSRAQQTYQRACDCQYMINGKCAYTILLPVGNGSSGTCSGSGTSMTSSLDDVILQQLQHNVSYLLQWSQNESMLVSQLQGVLLTLLSNTSSICTGCYNTGCDVIVSSTLGILNVTVQRQAIDISDIKTEVLQQATNLQSLNESYLQLSNYFTAFQKYANATLVTQTAQIEQLTSTVTALSQWTCTQRSALYSWANTSTTPVITFSSVYFDNSLTTINVRYTGANGAWCPSDPSTLPVEWVQFDLWSDTLVFGVITRGRTDYAQWVTSYQLNYTAVGTTTVSNETQWISYADELNLTLIFAGNVNQTMPVVNMLWNPIRTRFLRVIPLSAAVANGNKCMRVDIIGCTSTL